MSLATNILRAFGRNAYEDNIPIITRLFTATTLVVAASTTEIVLPAATRVAQGWLHAMLPPPPPHHPLPRYWGTGMALEAVASIGFNHHRRPIPLIFFQKSMLLALGNAALSDDSVPSSGVSSVNCELLKTPPSVENDFAVVLAPSATQVQDSLQSFPPTSPTRGATSSLGSVGMRKVFRPPPAPHSLASTASHLDSRYHSRLSSPYASSSSIETREFETLHALAGCSDSDQSEVGSEVEQDDVFRTDGEIDRWLATQSDDPLVLEDGDNVYCVLDKVGQGGFASVFVASALSYRRDSNFPEKVAIKAYSKQSMCNSRSFCQFVYQEQRIMQEITTQSSGNFATRLLASFQDKSNLYLVMRYYPLDLWGLLCRMPVDFTLEVIQFYAAELILGIEQLHSLGIIHGDLKASNVLVTPTGHLALTDFNLSFQVDPGNQEALRDAQMRGYMVGTIGYLAPELLKWSENGVDYTGQVDLWAYGIILGELYRRGPFTPLYYEPDSRRQLELTEKWDVANELKDIEDPNFKDLMTKLLEKDPTNRIKLADVKAHPFFEDIDWTLVLERRLAPPFPVDDRYVSSPGYCNLYLPPVSVCDPPEDIDWDYLEWRCQSEKIADPAHGDCQLHLYTAEYCRSSVEEDASLGGTGD